MLYPPSTLMSFKMTLTGENNFTALITDTRVFISHIFLIPFEGQRISSLLMIPRPPYWGDIAPRKELSLSY